MSDQPTAQAPEHSHPGPVLRAAREEAGLSIQQAADQLHLRPSVVEALENEAYSELGSIVFLKGYFRSYCRLVQLHEARMIALLDAQLDLQAREQQAHLDNQRDVASWRQAKFLLPVIVIIVLLAVFIFVFGEQQTPVEDSNVPAMMAPDGVGEANETADEAVEVSGERLSSDGSSATDAGARVSDSGDTATLDAPEYSETRTNDSAPAALSEDAALTTLPEQTELVSAPAPASSANTAPAQAEDASESAVAGAAATTAEIQMQLAFSFSGDCWVQIKTTSGRVLKAALMRTGNSLSLSSNETLEVVLGDASQVNLLVNGTVYPVRDYMKRSGRAAFRLSPNAI